MIKMIFFFFFNNQVYSSLSLKYNVLAEKNYFDKYFLMAFLITARHIIKMKTQILLYYHLVAMQPRVLLCRYVFRKVFLKN